MTAGAWTMLRTIGVSLLAPAFIIALLASLQAQNDRPQNDAIARLGKQIETGAVTLDYRPDVGYLPSLLQQLDVAIDSQVLVFSKTSFQQALITPQNPRAIYFNDNVSIGTVPGGEVYELLAVDPTDGVAFYTLADKADGPTAFSASRRRMPFLSQPWKQRGAGTDPHIGVSKR